MIDFSKNHFALFGLEPAFHIDLGRVEQTYRDIQAQVHPDKFSHAPDTERRLSMQWATHVNEAYQTLKQPISRARYLLGLRGVETQEETNTAMPAAFLMEQMEWREAIGEAKDAADVTELDQLHLKLRKELHALQETLGAQLDQAGDNTAAAETVRKLRFLEKLKEEINDALEALEA